MILEAMCKGPEEMGMFMTDDGYILYFQPQELAGSGSNCNLEPDEPGSKPAKAAGMWVDSLDPELQDNFWYGDNQSPWDVDSGLRLTGRLLTIQEEIREVINCLKDLPGEASDRLSWAISVIEKLQSDFSGLKREVNSNGNWYYRQWMSYKNWQ